MNNSLVHRIAVALVLFTGLSLVPRDGVVHEQRKNDFLTSCAISVDAKEDIKLCPCGEVLDFVGKGLQGFGVRNWSQTSAAVPPGCFKNRVGILPTRNARGLAPPLPESV